ncbi:RHS repeat-associated core domain-containing protein [Pseudomonas sp. BIC9C]|uniref:RHS repeat domain-containing protein n=1 Tax=Pseudomonas sp. BIC9C TaxID=3078458 RepID=UPI002AD52790|nr:RHS repeat-associated core domain-containing protein [Pseudomonas sp. BIC9C]
MKKAQCGGQSVNNPSIHWQTPLLTVRDPRAMTVRGVQFWRDTPGLPAQARVNRTAHDWAGRAIAQWDPRLFPDASAPANLQTLHALSGAVLSTDSVDAGWRVALLGEAGQSVHAWDSRGSQRWMRYDTQLRPVSVFEQAVDGDAICTERLNYGGSDQTSAERNQCGQLIRHDDPAGTQLFSEFGLHGAGLEQARHFLKALSLPDWPEPVADRELMLEVGEGAITRSHFNALGEVSQQTDAKGHRQLFSQTLDGQLREVRLQLNGTSTPKNLVSAIGYNAHGQTEREVAGNGVITTLEYDAQNGRLTRLQAQRGTAALQDLHYEYDPVGNVLSIEDAALPIRYFANQRIEPVSRYRYDSLGQLIEATGWEAGTVNKGPLFSPFDDPAPRANYRQTYHYDAGGNLLELTHDGPQSHGHRLVAAVHSNRCLPVLEGVEPDEEDFLRGFDGNGNLLSLQPGQTLGWDLRNQLREVRPVVRDSGLDDRERYVYGADGMRVRKVRETQSNVRTLLAETRYLPNLELCNHGGTGEVLQVISVQAGRSSVRVLHWETELPKGIGNDQYRYHLNDHLGSCTLELDEDGEVISQERYHPYGTTAWFAGRGEVEASYKTVRYSGKERDATGLYYYGFRYYVVRWQRWLSPDPAGEIDGLNLYRMVGGNPVILIDESGLMMKASNQLAGNNSGYTQEVAFKSDSARVSREGLTGSSSSNNSRQLTPKNELVINIVERLVDIVVAGRGGMRVLQGEQFDQVMIKLSAFYIDIEAGGKLSAGKDILKKSKGFNRPPRDIVNQSREKNDLFSFLTPYVSRELNSENYCLQNVTSDLQRWTEQILDKQKKRLPDGARDQFLSRMRNAADPEITSAAFAENPISRPPESQEEALQYIYFMAGQYEGESEWADYARDMYVEEYPHIKQVSYQRALAVYKKNKALGVYK